MKKTVSGLILLLVVVFFLSLAPSAALAKMRVAVLDFQDNSGAGAPGGAIADMMTTELFNAGVFTVVERNQLGAVAAEQRLAGQGLVDPSTAVQMGKVLGVEGLITGSITQYYYKGAGGVVPLHGLPGFSGVAVGSKTAYVTLDVRMINAQTGEIMNAVKEQGAANQTMGGLAYDWAVFGTGKAGGLLGQATYNSVVKIVERLKSTAGSGGSGGGASFNVVQSTPTEILIDAGSANAGAKVGDLFLIYVEGQAIIGLKGEVLDVEKVNLAVIRLTEVQPQYSRGQIVKGTSDVRRADKAAFFSGDPATVKMGIR